MNLKALPAFITNLVCILLILIVVSSFIFLIRFHGWSGAISFVVLMFTALLIIQSLCNLLSMLFSWNDPHSLSERKSPTTYVAPLHSFTALVPVRDEEFVIGDTIRAIDQIDYPSELKQIIIICRSDDHRTIDAVQKSLKHVQSHKVKLLICHTELASKPCSLNLGMSYMTGDIAVVFDAEDEPHKDIYKIVNTVFINNNADVVQSGVQLMDYRSSWYSTFNVLEYYFWFKSALHAYASIGVIPLGGNTVFIKKEWLEKVGGWNPDRLTEDADIGIKLSIAGARMQVIYDEQHATREETPHSLESFVKQRTRWNQGFMQIFFSFEWLRLGNPLQVFMTGYILLVPQIQTLWILYIPLSIYLLISGILPIPLALFSVIPMYILLIQFVTYNLGLWEFTRDYKLSYPFWMPLKLALTFVPYQLVLGFSAMRASFRFFTDRGGWEKTEHSNIHRKGIV